LGKYLIVEDNEDKKNLIERELLSLGIRVESIDWAISVNKAKELLKVNKYDVAVLDLNLPIFDFKQPIDKGGLNLLEKLNANSDKYFSPRYIICLTAFENIIETQSTEFKALDLIIQTSADDTWKQALKNRVEWSSKVVREQDKSRLSESQLLVNIHGIRTQGQWQKGVSDCFKEHNKNLIIKEFKYNYFSAFQLLIPFFRSKVIKTFKDRVINLIDEHPNARITFIAHSFGTYILAKCLEKIPLDVEFKIDAIILAGCVLKEKYNWNPTIKRYNADNIINECGYNDNILLLSRYFCIDMGKAGRSGFIGLEEVTNRFYKGGHDFFYQIPDFFTDRWLPVLNNDITPIDERSFGTFRENMEIIISSPLSALILYWALPVYFFIR
jgi:CheY-like chemotaxis protein